MYKELMEINSRPQPFQFYTAEELWTNEHTAKQMLKYHLDKSIDAASRNHDFINKSSAWIISHFKQNEVFKIADFGCGPGLYATRLSELGAVVTGIDFSQNSLDYARNQATEKGLKIDYYHTNYLKFDTIEDHAKFLQEGGCSKLIEVLAGK